MWEAIEGIGGTIPKDFREAAEQRHVWMENTWSLTKYLLSTYCTQFTALALKEQQMSAKQSPRSHQLAFTLKLLDVSYPVFNN